MAKRKERSQILHLISDRKKRAFYVGQMNKTKTVLFEAEEDNGIMYGFTENYVKVKTTYEPSLVNSFRQVELANVDRDMIAKINFEQTEAFVN